LERPVLEAQSAQQAAQEQVDRVDSLVLLAPLDFQEVVVWLARQELVVFLEERDLQGQQGLLDLQVQLALAEVLVLQVQSVERVALVLQGQAVKQVNLEQLEHLAALELAVQLDLLDQ